MMSVELKPCPFCGRSESVRLRCSGEQFVVVCDASTAARLNGCGGSGGYAVDRGRAIAAWNTRALEQREAVPVAAVEPIAVSDLPAFPTMLRKMWSGGEVQRWINDNIKPLIQERHHDQMCATPPRDVPDGFYIASFKRSGSSSPGVLWWMADNRGYSTDLEQAGVYTEIVPGYHDNEYTVPVPVSAISALRVRRVVDPGDSLNQAFYSAKSLRAMLAAAPSGEGNNG